MTSSWRFPVIAKIDCAPWNKLSLLRVINLQQARTCFSLLKVQWWSQRIPGVLVVSLSIWVLRVVATKDVDCLDIWALEEWTYFLKVFSQFSSWKFLDLQHVTFLQFFPWFVYESGRHCSCEKGLSWWQTFVMRTLSLSQVRWFSSCCWVISCDDSAFLISSSSSSASNEYDGSVSMSTAFWKIAAKSLREVEVVDHVGLITCGRGCIGHRATLFILWIFAVFVDRQRSLRCRWGWRIGRPRWNTMCKQEDEDECACDIMGDLVINLFLCGRHNLEIFSQCTQGLWVKRKCACRSVTLPTLWTTELDKKCTTTKGYCTRTFVLCFLAYAGNPQFNFQHGPFTKRFKPVVTRVPAVVLYISRFYRLAVTRAWTFALNKLTTEGTGTYNHLGPRPLRMSWSTYCRCIAVIACGIGLFHMARASSRPTSAQITTTKQYWLWGLAACFTAPPGAHTCLKCAYVFTPPSVTVDRYRL